jgi:cation transport ATPase
VITVLVLLGQVLELRARESTSGAIRALLDLAPKQARRVRAGGTEEEIPLAKVQAGDRLRVIAMGTGTDVAIESAGVTLLNGELAGVLRPAGCRARSCATSARTGSSPSSTTRRGTRGGRVLYPALGILLSPMIAAAAMSVSSVSVIANALGLRAARL